MSDGSALKFDENIICEKGISMSGTIAGMDSLNVGATVSIAATLKIRDTAEIYKNTDFSGAIFNIDIINNNVTYHKGKFRYIKSSRKDGVITFELRDNMQKTEKTIEPLNDGTAMSIMTEIATRCGYTNAFTGFPNSNLVIKASELIDITYRQLINYIAQIAGCFAIFNPSGELLLKSYPKTILEDTADVKLNNNTQINISEKPTTITGVAVIIGEGDTDSRYLSGAEGYVLELSDNPLITSGNIQSVLSVLNDSFVDMSYYGFNSTSHSDPRVELADTVFLYDYKGNGYPSMIMTYNYTISSAERFSAVSKSDEEQNSNHTDIVTKIVNKANNVAKQLLSKYDEVAANMTELISQGFGMYTTKVKQDDGSYINYMHDAANLEDSSVIWKLTSTGLLVSKNGGTSWAVDSNGNALFNIITARKIGAEQLTTETIIGKHGNINLAEGTFDYGDISWDGETLYLNPNVVDLIVGSRFSEQDSRIESLENQVDGTVTIYTAKEAPTLNNYPAADWHVSYYPPFDDASAEDYQFPGSNTWMYTAEEYRKHLGSIVYVEGSSDSYKFIMNEDGEFIWKLIENSETAYIMNQIAELRVSQEGLTSEVSDVKGIITNQGVAIQQNASSIKQTSESITSEVTRATNAENALSSKIGNNSTKIEQTNKYISQNVVKNGEVVSKINASQEGVAIKGNKISLEGTVTANNNFKILTDGSMEAKNGKFTGDMVVNNSLKMTVYDTESETGGAVGEIPVLLAQRTSNENQVIVFPRMYFQNGIISEYKELHPIHDGSVTASTTGTITVPIDCFIILRTPTSQTGAIYIKKSSSLYFIAGTKLSGGVIIRATSSTQIKITATSENVEYYYLGF